MNMLEQLVFALASGGLVVFLVGLGCLLWLAVYFLKTHWQVEWTLRRHTARRQALREQGQFTREELLVLRQRGNLAELAALVREQLVARREAISLGLYHQTLESIRDLVATLQFARLHALHELLVTTDAAQTSPRLQAFLRQEHHP